MKVKPNLKDEMRAVTNAKSGDAVRITDLDAISELAARRGLGKHSYRWAERTWRNKR